MSDMNLTPETQPEAISADEMSERHHIEYADALSKISAKASELYWVISKEIDRHNPASREWQEMYAMARMANIITDTARLASERHEEYIRPPF